MPQSLHFRLLSRQTQAHDRKAVDNQASVDFLVSGESLLERLAEASDGDTDFKGCFWSGLRAQNEKTLGHLLCELPPETEHGRILIYVYPECGDLGCGAYTAKVSAGTNSVRWEDFAYENGRDRPILIAGVGPFEFDLSEYSATVAAASEA